MHKYLLLIIVAAFNLNFAQSLYIPANGGAARVLAMGKNPYITDPENMRNNPAWGNYYRNMFWVNYGTQEYSGQHGGINIECNNVFTLGVIYNRNCSSSTYPFTIDNLNIMYNRIGSSNYEVFASGTISDKVSIGAGFAVADINRAYADKKQYGINFGTVIRMQNKFYIDAAANINLPYSYRNREEEYKMSRFSLNFRGLYLLNENLFAVAQINYYKTDEEYPFELGTINDSWRTTDFNIGMAFHNSSYLVSGGFGLGSTSRKMFSSESNSYINITLGAEFYIGKYIIPRIGLDSKTIGSTFGLGNLDLGMGIHIYKFQLDGYYSYDLEYSGTSQYNGVYLSLSYKY
jgi:hypothetical protein